ncbi:hypothetical protein JKP88DRAFT_250736 [Tribonema minus]|uniref:Uncharacterized protein n=1 Tax=Tribonema minus TaxID=303371 RepID=A0A836CN61_9STRA|nr:hypothetical protein JKP88DRAFT_250736 [Tribonema minus]
MHYHTTKFILDVAYPDHKAIEPRVGIVTYWSAWFDCISLMFDGDLPAGLRAGLSRENHVLADLCAAASAKIDEKKMNKMVIDDMRRTHWIQRVREGNAKAERERKMRAHISAAAKRQEDDTCDTLERMDTFAAFDAYVRELLDARKVAASINWGK